MIKSVFGLVCGLLVACGGAVQRPAPALGTIETCAGGAVHGQAELTRFQRCSLVLGDLTISDVHDLSPVSNLRAVTGRLTLEHTELESLRGLEQLEAVGQLAVDANPKLDSIAALERFEHTTRIELREDPALRTLKGLSGIRELERLSIIRTGLYSMSGLETLTKVDDLELVDNSKLIDPRALNGLREIRHLSLHKNPRLCARFGLLAALETADIVKISDNIGLEHAAVSRLMSLRTPTKLAAR